MLCARAGHPPRAVAGDPGRVPSGVLGDDLPLELPVLLEPAPALDQALRAIARNPLGLRRALGSSACLASRSTLRRSPLVRSPSGSSSPRASP